MNQKKMTLNKVDIDLEIVDNLLIENRKIEAIKYIIDKCNMGLKEAKDFIDFYSSGNENEGVNFNVSRQERVQIKMQNNTIQVKYFDNDGLGTYVDPNHPLWQNVKRIMPNNERIEDYEKSFFEEKNESSHSKNSRNANPITIQTKNSGNLIIIVLIIIAILVSLYLMN